MNEQDIKFRCSSLGDLMTDDRSGKAMGDTCKKYLTEVYVNMKYQRTRIVTTKYMEKGNLVEEDAITLYSRVKKTYFQKNYENLTNEFITGTPDLYRGEEISKATEIIDTKACWDIFTFFRTYDEKVNKDYYWQLQGYMALTGATVGHLAYCLVNTPESLIEGEKKRLAWAMDRAESNKDFIEACKQLEKNMKYDEIPITDRLHEIDISRNDKDIERIYERVKEARTYILTHYPNL